MKNPILSLSSVYCLPCLFSFIFICSTPVVAQDTDSEHIGIEYPNYKNRVSLNLLGLTSSNITVGYERASKNKAIWIGLNHHLNGLFDKEDRKMSSLAVEYRYYFFSNRDLKPSNGFFAGAYSKYRVGSQTRDIIPYDRLINYTHKYNVVFAGINTGYRYNYKRLALSSFVGYGFPIIKTENRKPEVSSIVGSGEFNEGYTKDLRLGITIGIAF